MKNSIEDYTEERCKEISKNLALRKARLFWILDVVEEIILFLQQR